MTDALARPVGYHAPEGILSILQMLCPNMLLLSATLCGPTEDAENYTLGSL